MFAMNTMFIYPMVALFALTIVIMLVMFKTRVKAVKDGKMKISDFKVYNTLQTDEVIQVSRHFSNLFETPVLFYTVSILGLLLNMPTIPFAILAWLYVAARIVHAYIHVGRNKIMYRMRVFGLSVLILVIMWVLVLVRALSIAS